jgi:hypothetical protein
MSILLAISISDDVEKVWTNLWWRISIKKLFSITKISFPDSIEIDDKITPINAELSMNSTFRGITIDWSDENENALHAIRVNREFDSNVIDENDLQYAKQFGPRASIFIPTSIDDDSERFRINLWWRTSIISWWFREISNQFVMGNINQKVVLNNKDLIPWFNWDWWQSYTHKCRTINEFNISWNRNSLKWWIWKCFRFNSCQKWIWFKCDWWKCFTPRKTFWSKNFHILWNQDWLKWWTWKCTGVNSRQKWIWFKCDWWMWLVNVIDDKFTPTNAEPSINWTFCGITIDSSDDL